MMNVYPKAEFSVQYSGFLFDVTDRMQPVMTKLKMYEATRGIWHKIPSELNLKFAFAIVKNVIKEVYSIESWEPANLSSFTTRKFRKKNVEDYYQFVGTLASEDVRKMFKNKRVTLDLNELKVDFLTVGLDNIEPTDKASLSSNQHLKID